MKKIELTPDFSARTYQQSIFAKSMNKNSLIVLPTGLGKTIVAIMLSIYHFNKTNKKILFLAPTRPLVEQQEKSYKSFFKNKDEFNFKVLTGQVLPQKRINAYKENDFIFSTPQLIENDIVNKIINPKDFALVIFDEAHRATGNYAYNFIAEQFNKQQCKILALTASPGTSKEEIENIMQNLKIENIEVKRYEDSDVKPYVKEKEIKTIKVKLDDRFTKIKDNLHISYNKRLKILKDLGFFQKKPASQITKKDLLDLQQELRLDIAQSNADEVTWRAISTAAALMKLAYGIELFESQEFSAAHTYFYNFFRAGGDKSKAAQELQIDINFREAFDELAKLKKANILHPKLIKLKEIVNQEIQNNKDLKIIIFNQYRDSATKIVEELNKIKEINSALFVGQAKKGDMKMSQKDQKQIIEKFRESEYNIIVSTSVGEEGLDIPKVDLVIFYEPVPSAIRTIQRIGRTGRFKKGRALILVTEKTRDETIRFISNAKEKKMHRVLKEIRDESLGSREENKNKTLSSFISNKNEDENENKAKIDAKSDLPKIYIDNRENNDLLKELFNSKEIEVEAKRLDVADIIITEQIAIERKAKSDFVNSIIDKRLFEQLINLSKNFYKPILILEGEQSLFTIRNINPNVIRATLSAIAVDLRIPILYTNSLKETREMIEVITKRAYKPKKEISLASDKRAFSENEELEKFISTIPKVNVMTAKLLLNHFSSVEKIVNAKKDEFLKIEGIGEIRAKFLVEFFRREYNPK